MDLFQEFSLSWINAGWYSLLYGIVSIGLMLTLPKEKRKRILTFPTFKNTSEKILSGAALFLFGRGLIVLSIFIPIQLYTFNFYFGSILYLIAMCSSLFAMWTFSKAKLDKPVTGGIYKITRHPMQVMTLIMWFGISIASSSLLLVILAISLGFISYPSLKAQERFCIDNYGEDYILYMKQTPRYLFF